MRKSQASIIPELEQRVQADPISLLYTTIRDYATRAKETEVPWNTLQSLACKLGLGQDYLAKLNKCLDDHDQLGVWSLRKTPGGEVASVIFHPADVGIMTQQGL
jgi:hypothetical protein